MKPDTYIPLPVQSFLMSHTFSFLQNPSAREGICMTFEKVIVQNILHGRSIVLCEAIQSMPRWQFIRASFPHVLHCGAIMLREKLRTTFADTQQSQKQTRAEQLQSSVDRGPLQFSQAETKLLYTLHWILLDAASECEDADLEVTQPKASITGPNKGGLLHDLASIQLFVYLFAPLIEQLKAVDFETLKLEAGLSIWVPLMANQQPLATLLSSPVKLFDFRYTPFGTQLVLGDTHRHGTEQKSAVYHGLVTKKHGIYVGEQNAVSSSGTSKPIKCNEDHDETGPMSKANEGTGKSTASEVTFANGAVDGSPIPPKATTESMDDEDDKHQSEAQVGDKLSDNPDIGFNRIQKFIIDQTEKMRSEKLQFPAGTDPVQTTSNSTALLATHFDVAVVRCLYCSEWTEPGVYWSLLYLFKRLLQVRSDWAQVKRETAKLIRMTKGRAVQHCPQKPYLFWSHMPSALLLNIRSASMPELSHTSFNRPIPSSLNQTDAAWRPDVMGEHNV
ncbi:unnamed protein product [Dicrocoelium dendriticum]|nr:unnamed protein product [Dicrocoelium dendriticum]